MAQPWRADLPGLAERLAAPRPVLLGLDFDGTLAPIQPWPDAAQLPSATRSLLTRLVELPGLRVAVVSGRALADVRSRVGLSNVLYAGNHGLEMAGPAGDQVHPEAEALRQRLAGLVDHLAAAVTAIPGTLVEAKGVSASVHFRNTPAEHHDEVGQRIRDALASADDAWHARVGHMVWEIVPRIAWNKGNVLRHWFNELGGLETVIYIGDDRTDEDAFAAFPEHVTIRVGAADATSARYLAADPADVVDFLTWLSAMRVN
jgi:trehalose 6-phosphate phosphatase